jgi:hypothetical protein
MGNLMGATSAVVTLVLSVAACGSQDARPANEPAEDGKASNGSSSPSDVTWVAAEDYSPSLFDENAVDVGHRWYPLQPGMRLDYRGSSLDEGERLDHEVTVIVTDLVKEIDGVPNVLVWERDYTEGELVETELSFFAQDVQGNVWHMGEYPEEWEDGQFDKAPAWLHGVKGATAGITIPARPETGTPDFAEGFAPPPVAWQDRGKVHATGERVCVPADCYTDVVVIAEFERNVPGAFQDKFYAPDVGVVRVGWRGRNDEDKEVLELERASTLTPAELDSAREQALRLEERAYQITEDVWSGTPPAHPQA